MKTKDKKHIPLDRYKFSRSGEVVRDHRRTSTTFNTDAYVSGDPIYAPRRSSPAREKFHAARIERRSAPKAAKEPKATKDTTKD